MNAATLLLLDRPISLRPTPQPRAPLPPFDPAVVEGEPPALHPVYTELWSPPLPSPNVRYWRGDAWGVTVPNLPAWPAVGAGHRVLTWFLDQYGREWEDPILDAHLIRGYTHFSLCPQESMMGPSQMSLKDYVAMSKRVREAGFFVHHLIRSKYYDDGSDPAAMRPILDALLEADAMQVETPAWECNYIDPIPLRKVIDHDAAVIGTACVVMLHFYAHYIAWQEDGHQPAEFWQQNHGKVDGVLYQMDPHWTAGMMAARINDGQTRLCPGGTWGLGLSGRPDPQTGEEHAIDLTDWESTATVQFYDIPDGNGRPGDEDHGNLKSYETLGTPGPMPIMGFGNGGRFPNGTVI